MLFCQGIVLHMHVQTPRSNLDYRLADIASRGAPGAYFWAATIAYVAIFLRSPFLIVFWLAASALFWALFITHRGP